MSTPRDPDTILAAWLEEGPNALPEPTKRAIAVNTRTMNQRRHLTWMPQRSPAMNAFVRIAAAAIVVVAILGGAVYLLAPGGGVGGGPPASAAPSATSVAPSAAPSRAPAASTALGPLDTTTWKTFTSARYGFSVGHPAGWTERPSDHVWAFPADAGQFPPPGAETFLTPADDVGVSAWSVGVTADTSLDAWVQAYCQVAESDTPCSAIPSRTIAASMDGHAGQLVRFAEDTQAFVLVGGRMYIVGCWRPEADSSVSPFGGASRLLQGYLSTMHLLPSGPASPAPSATPRPS